jgi:hypothetical protein
MVYLTRFSESRTTEHQTVGSLVKNQLERIWKEAVMAYSKHYSHMCLEKMRGKKSSVKIADVLAEIQTKQLPNTGLEHYC